MPGAKPSPQIESRADLIEAMARGAKPKDTWRVGTEHEKFVFYRKDNSPVPYEGSNGIRALLEGVMDRTGSSPIHDGDALIGLEQPNGGGSISLEPGGQFELSGAPLRTLHETCVETNQHLKLMRAIAEPLGIGFLGLGAIPTWSVADIPKMPKSRYAIMGPYMEKVGTLGTSMMFRSCTVQANLDFSDEADMVKKLRVSLALQPVATALFANSPFIDGKPSPYLSFRSQIWLDTDPDRTGMIPFAFEDGMGFERYADYALDVPMYFVVREGRYINCAGESFRAFLGGQLPQLPGEKPTIKDWEDHLSTLFPEVRLKQYLEMRGADAGPWQELCALPALWTGLLYDSAALDAAWEMVKDWTAEERDALRRAVPRSAIHTPFRNETVADIGARMLELARGGLARRANLNWEGEDETIFLAPIAETLRTGKTAAEDLVDLYKGEWQGDISRVFERAAF
ncbi:glutamate--cysteine ligase [Arsenicitalea aurantiaca]|uniref:Glutamate--cysteine ligase n=1 Tax=Arsenicitalea aurantiaca TaxID=1783274 RepID=A0A433XAU5_9HYPH|nr:glutamate--cysteine ligase [Arsenicitalea aurantiaca]RUT31183.1 glutamate--cysteine ligase [Arsenicitalea aurantiaca]